MTDVMIVGTNNTTMITNEWAADVNCDGVINTTDAMIIWYVITDYPYPGAYEVNCCE